MAEYIKRDVAYNVLCDGCNACNGNHEICDEYRMISGIPAADVRENVHARWKNTAIGNWACSYCCREPYYSGNIEDYLYCPYCGASMKGETEKHG